MIKEQLYKVWFWIGCRMMFFRTYNIKRDKSMKLAKQALEEAFSPQLKKMLSEKLKDE
tara:strand:- start:373 stop:546 length:174 start_codon:yes stop_codon:yes gene_type:complete